MFSKRPATIALPHDPSIRRNAQCTDELLTRPAGDQVLTVGDIFAYTVSPHYLEQ